MYKPRKTHLRVLVCGGRDFSDFAAVKSVLDRIHRHRTVVCVIHGAARGADSLGGAWATARGVMEEAFPARWDEYGKAAGFKRNEEMLRFGCPDVVVAFPGGRGTAHMVDLARRANVPVWEPLATPA